MCQTLCWVWRSYLFYKGCNSELNVIIQNYTRILINAANCMADYIFDRNKVYLNVFLMQLDRLLDVDLFQSEKQSFVLFHVADL